MATAKVIKEKAYFDEVYKELEDMKMKICQLREELFGAYGKDNPVRMAHDRHLLELSEYIDWKLQVLEKGTSFDWNVARGIEEQFESEVSVQPGDLTGPDFSGGYIGG